METEIIYTDTTKRKTWAYASIFLFTIISGVIRKWILSDTGTGNIIFLFQLMSLFFFFVRDAKGSLQTMQNKWLSFYLILLIFMAINPLNLTVYHGLVGILLHLGLWFGCFYYLYNRDEFDFSIILNVFVVVAFTEIILAFVQYSLPPDNFLNRYADDKQVGGIYATVGTAVRVTGTFSYISGFSSYLLFHAYLVWALIKLNYRPFITIALMVFGLVAAFMNGSRGATYVYLVIMIYFLIFEARGSNIGQFLPRLVVPGLVLYMVLLANGSLGIESNVTEAYDNFQDRTTELRENGEENKRVWGPLDEVVHFRGNYPILGIGLGSTYQGNHVMFGVSPYLLEYGFIESELARIVLEGGFVLLIMRLMLTIYFCSFLSFQLTSKILIGALFFMTPTIFNIYNSIFTFAGVVLLDNVYYRDKLKKEAEEEEAVA
jgi:hypothetical protein